MLSRIVLFSGAAILVAVAALAAGCGGTRRAGERRAGSWRRSTRSRSRPSRSRAAAPTVRNLTPAGAEPHDLELTPSDVRAVHDASLVLYLGDGFMPGLETAVEQRQGRSLDVLAELRRQAGYAGGTPRRSPRLARSGALRRDGAADRRGARDGDAARRAWPAGSTRSTREYRRGLAHCARRQIVTSHAAFGYLAARYGLEQVPLEGLTPEAEPSARDIARLVDVVRSSGATTVFFETLISPKLAETVAREAGVKTAVLDPLEGIGEERHRRRSRLLLGHAGEPRDAAEGARMHELSDPVVELDGVSFGYRAGVRVLEDVVARRRAGRVRRDRRAERRRQDDARCGSCSGSSARARARVRVFGEAAGKGARRRRGSATSRSGRGSSVRRR